MPSAYSSTQRVCCVFAFFFIVIWVLGKEIAVRVLRCARR
ncbi:unnamed protein product [Brassica rapa subsp. trilocularis]